MMPATTSDPDEILLFAAVSVRNETPQSYVFRRYVKNIQYSFNGLDSVVQNQFRTFIILDKSFQGRDRERSLSK
jgi:hypothetical protein